ncbi:ribosome production factor 2 [Nematocida sp. AWRm78]|nr:ribosome production factor 2 [Nematocida sp. AWRm79]KAI5184713.1 ribosome production factor 2 [Nematocida sp. AWRm78]
MKKDKKPCVIEPAKKLLILSPTPNTPGVAQLISFFMNIKQNAVKYTDKDGVYQPTTSNSSVSNGKLEGLLKRMDCSLFAYIYTNKTNQPRLIIGRTHEFQIVELAQYKVAHSLTDLSLLTNSLHILLVHRNGYTDPLKLNLLMDFLRDAPPSSVGLGIIKYAIGIDLLENTIVLNLLEIEPSPFKLVPVASPITLEIVEEHRMNFIQQKETSKQVRQTEKKIKNVEKGILNSTLGILHLEKQDLREIQLSKGRAFKKIGKK